ncbi:MAG: hypothetical protein ACM3QS_17070, partial [Bacteroidota bacterium]
MDGLPAMTTSSPPPRIKNLPVLLLILANVIAGLFTFRDYGMSLDEPLFYAYADALGYAYSPAEWLKPGFDLEQAFGPSPWDHRNRGPAYLLLARGPAHLFQRAGLDQASSWHLVNFLSFQVGVFFFYVLARRWMSPWAAFFAAALFSWQPVLWEHAFINPKDPPFLVFFLISLELGFRMADQLAAAPAEEKPRRLFGYTLLPAILLGLTTSIRVLGPLAGVLVALYLLLRKPSRRAWLGFAAYGIIAILVMFASWPFLWEAPVRNFMSTLTFMADNPTELRVLFYGEIYRADNLPLRYLPALLLFALTEPVWPLAAAGGLVAVVRARARAIEWRSLLATFLWLAIPLVYVLLARPPMYDGFRHFMFIVPPLFLLAGLAVDALFIRLRNVLLRAAVILALLLPGLAADVQLHPYQYTYYNSFVGGTGQAARSFETDYWFTCYKDAMQRINRLGFQHPRVFVRRESALASYYASPQVTVVNASLAS